MTTFAIEPAQYASGPYDVRIVPEAASQSFKQGEFVYLVNGKATVISSNATVILGMAEADASAVTDTDVRVVIAHPNTAFRMTAYEDGGGTNDTIAVTDKGVKYALVVVSNVTCADTGDTDNDAIVIRDFVDAVGDIFPKVLISVLPEAFQGGAAAT